MKVAIFSDIHGNNYALTKVLEEVHSRGISRIIICGDFIGYYYNVDDVLKLIKNYHVTACRGNHEDFLAIWQCASCEEKKKISEKYGKSYQLSGKQLTQKQRNWLLGLHHPISGEFGDKKALISHGSPWDINAYLYENNINDYQAEFTEISLQYDVVFVGHSHYQYKKSVAGVLVVNPGSVGQPRSGKSSSSSCNISRAQWAIWDTDSMEIELITTQYNNSLLFIDIDQHDPEKKYFKNVLLRNDEKFSDHSC